MLPDCGGQNLDVSATHANRLPKPEDHRRNGEGHRDGQEQESRIDLVILEIQIIQKFEYIFQIYLFTNNLEIIWDLLLLYSVPEKYALN